jgi:hypothetical protein
MPSLRPNLRSSDPLDFEHMATMKDIEELTHAEQVRDYLPLQYTTS